ncbi:HAD-IIB family hydrolase [Pleurocapsales cyanobacterium LEGE 10410]|nr:HAD-IIB family hydrolase [Pleurocapsales cyanobacterium LEGE 10410]
MKYVVVTDLDGTLLDHQTYKFTPALKAIAQLQQQNIPIVLNSSKTQAEILEIRHELDNQEPFVCENGGVVCGISPESRMSENSQETKIYLGIPRAEFLPDVRKIRQKLQLRCQGFAESSVTEIMQWTGLSISNVQKAMQREATEPLYWQDTELALNNFQQELENIKLKCVRGGRFHHVMGLFDKASCLPQLKAYYSQRWQEKIGIVALGDSPNDLPMLEQADYAIVIPSIKGSLKPNRDDIFFATKPGPSGWQEGIDFFLNRAL